MADKSTIAVLGSGAWGTALSVLLARNGHRVRLWGNEPAQLEELKRERTNKVGLPGITIPADIEPEADLRRAMASTANVLIAVPSHAFRSMLEALRPIAVPAPMLAWATKGLEPGTGRLLSDVAPHRDLVDVYPRWHD